MTQVEISEKFELFNNQMERLYLLKNKILYERKNFINQYRNEIKNNYLPKKGDIFLYDDIYADKFNKIGYLRLCKYVRVVKSILYADFTGFFQKMFPTVTVEGLDENFKVIDYLSGDCGCADVDVRDLKIKVDRNINRNIKPTNIYVMIDNYNGFYKIGRSINPKIREKTLQSEKPSIEILYNWPGNNEDEYILHKQFKDKRLRGEWFKLDNKDLFYIDNYFKNKLKPTQP